MVLGDRPILRGFLQLALVVFLVVIAAAVMDILSRLGNHHPNWAGIATLLILAGILTVGRLIDRVK